MKSYDVIILQGLLDKYENSLLSKGNNVKTIHIEFKFTKKTLPEYFNISSTAFDDIHTCMNKLEDYGLIRIIWEDGRPGHVIDRVRLIDTELSKAYKYLGRIPKSVIECEAVSFIKRYIDGISDGVVFRFSKYITSRLQEHKSVKEYLDITDLNDVSNLFKAIANMELNQSTLYIRQFSVRVFNDSKAFETLLPRSLKVFRKFGDGMESMQDDDILAEYHIYRTPNYVYLKGNVKLEVSGKTMDLSEIRQGIGISGEDIANIRFADLSGIERVITIENLTSFFDFNERDCIVIYLGGYHNTVRRIFLSVLYEALPDAEYYHFGDIDAGGFGIFNDLKTKTGIGFKPYRMDVATLKEFRNFSRPLTSNDRKRLQQYTADPVWSEVAEYMLKHGVKLEQESIN